MNKYKIEFTGKIKGAIGSFQKFSVVVEAKNTKEAVIKLYDDYDHVHGPIVSIVKGADNKNTI